MSTGEKGFTLVELLVVVAIIGILAAIAIPQLLGARDKARTATCDEAFKTIAGEVGNELDTALNNLTGTGTCGTTTNDGVAACMFARHSPPMAAERNPRNRRENLFTTSNPHSCQVMIEPVSTNGIQFTQSPDGSSTRTYSIYIN